MSGSGRHGAGASGPRRPGNAPDPDRVDRKEYRCGAPASRAPGSGGFTLPSRQAAFRYRGAPGPRGASGSATASRPLVASLVALPGHARAARRNGSATASPSPVARRVPAAISARGGEPGRSRTPGLSDDLASHSRRAGPQPHARAQRRPRVSLTASRAAAARPGSATPSRLTHGEPRRSRTPGLSDALASHSRRAAPGCPAGPPPGGARGGSCSTHGAVTNRVAGQS